VHHADPGCARAEQPCGKRFELGFAADEVPAAVRQPDDVTGTAAFGKCRFRDQGEQFSTLLR